MGDGVPGPEELERIRRQLQQVRDPLALLEGIFTFAPLGLQIYDASGRSVLVNEAFRRMLGSEPPPEYNVLRDEIAWRDGFLDLIHRAFAGETVQIGPVWYDPRELEQVKVDGRRVALDVTLFPLTDAAGAVTHVALVFKDVSAELLAREQLERENRVKDQFLATLSHELRTPLHAIVGWTHLLHLGHLDELGGKRALEAVRRNASLLGRLIDDLLDVSRIVSGKLILDVQAVDVAAAIATAVEAVTPAADARSIRIAARVADDIPAVAADPARLQQMLSNVLGNAVKFTPAGGQARLDAERDGSKLRIEVRDDGPGFPADFLPRAFEPFQQADASTTRVHGGMGVGLALVRRLAEMHGGTAMARNAAEGTGAIVTLRLPLAR